MKNPSRWKSNEGPEKRKQVEEVKETSHERRRKKGGVRKLLSARAFLYPSAISKKVGAKLSKYYFNKDTLVQDKFLKFGNLRLTPILEGIK